MAGKPRVLIVDDEPDVLLTLRIVLEAEGFTVLLAGDGETALHRIDDEHPDLVVLDIMMPVLDGWFVLAELGGRSRRPRVVVCSAKTSPVDKSRAASLGADAYVTKPFDADDLVEHIRATLQQGGHEGDGRPPSAVVGGVFR
jgi:DNA-binding response OmpR family regulator